MHLRSFAFAFACAIFAAPSFASQHTWTDAQSGREFLLLSSDMTWNDSDAACKAQGYALSDLRFLTDDERKNFLASDALENLNWEVLYTGTPRETRLAHLWQSAQGGTIASNGFSLGSTQIVIQKHGAQMSTAEEWHGEEDTGRAVCMSASAFWYRCSMHFKCTIRSGESEFHYSTLYVDYGATANEAVRRIVERTQDPAASGPDECALETESRICIRELP